MRFLGLAWWKWMSIVLFVYVITRGLLVPLKPGILNINPSRFQVGQSVEFEIEGYNSFYTKATPRVFLKSLINIYVVRIQLKSFQRQS